MKNAEHQPTQLGNLFHTGIFSVGKKPLHCLLSYRALQITAGISLPVGRHRTGLYLCITSDKTKIISLGSIIITYQ